MRRKKAKAHNWAELRISYWGMLSPNGTPAPPGTPKLREHHEGEAGKNGGTSTHDTDAARMNTLNKGDTPWGLWPLHHGWGRGNTIPPLPEELETPQ